MGMRPLYISESHDSLNCQQIFQVLKIMILIYL